MGGLYKEVAANQASSNEGWRKHMATPSSRNTRAKRGGGTREWQRQRRQLPAGTNHQRDGYSAEDYADAVDQGCHDKVSQDEFRALESLFESLRLDRTDDVAKAHLPKILPYVRGNVVQLASSPKFCRFLQRTLELINLKDDLVPLVEELNGNVIFALESPHANHVLQKAIVLLPPCKVSFIAQELLSYKDGPAGLARHQYGCRVLERLIEHFPGEELQPLVDAILKDGKTLCKNQYGNFVLQHLVEHGSPHVRTKIVDLLLEPVEDSQAFVLNQHACGVVDAALTYGEQSDRLRLAEQLLSTQDLFLTLCKDKHRGGMEVVKHLLRMESQEISEGARMQLDKGADELQQTKHGKALLDHIHRP